MKKNSFYHILYVIFRKDIGRKAMALLLALILWVYLDQKVVLRDSRPIPIRVVEGEDEYYRYSTAAEKGIFLVLASNIMLMDDLEDTVIYVEMSGTKDLIESRLIGRKDIVSSDLDGRDSLKKVIQFFPDDFEILKGRPNVHVIFRPKQIQVPIARRASAKINLSRANMDFEGESELADKGIIVEDVGFDPTLVTIEGPKPEVDRIRQNPSLLKLESLTLRERSPRTMTGSLELSREFKDKMISLRESQTVRFTVNLSEAFQSIRLPNVDVAVKYKKDLLTPEELSNWKLVPDRITVIFKGTRSQLDSLSSVTEEALKEKLTAYIDLAQWVKGATREELSSLELKNTYIIEVFGDLNYFDQSVEFEADPSTVRVEKVESN